MTLVHMLTSTGAFYFLPVYFQGVLVKSPLGSGIALAPICGAILPFSMVAGILMSKVGKHRPFHIVGWSATIVAFGLCSTLDRRSSPAAWAGFEILAAAGIASLSVSLLPALQAPLSERHAATSAGMYCFARGFGSIWAVTIPAAIFNNVVKQRVTTDASSFATTPALAARLADGQAYQLATRAFLDSLDPSDSMVREQVIAVFEHAIHVVFYVLTAFAGLGLLLVLLVKEIPMRTENKTEFGLDESNKDGKTKTKTKTQTQAGVRDGDDSGGGAIPLENLSPPVR